MSYARFLVLETDVQCEDVRVLDAFRHVGMPRAVVQNQPTDKLRLGRRSVLHLHDLHHVQVNWLSELIWGIWPA